MSAHTRSSLRANSQRRRRRPALLIGGLGAVIAVLAIGHTEAQQGPAQPPLENFDIRTAAGAASRDYVGRHAAAPSLTDDLTSARAAGLARLQSVLAVDVIDSPTMGTVEAINSKAGAPFLTGGGLNRVATLRAFLSAYTDVYGLSQAQVSGLPVVADYVNPAGNMGWAEFEQRINGFPVFQALVRGGFTARGELGRITGLLAAGLDAGSLPTAPSLTGAQAVGAAAANVGWAVAPQSLVQKSSDANGHLVFDRGPMADDASAWLVYFPLAPGSARLAWAAQIFGNPEAYLILVDAEDGTMLFRKSLTEYQSQAASYNVYADDSPAPASPSPALPGANYQAPFIGRTTFSVIGNEPPNVFNNLGWIADNGNTTDGNAVEAGLDRVAPNGVDAPVAGTAFRVFDFSYNPQTDEPLAGYPPINNYQKGEVTNMFYWTNVFHDRLYLLGFTEAARNFQNDNFGRGGAAADRISAEAEDSSGTNNANFSVGPDGVRGRMQMYVFPGPTPDRTSGIDQDIMLHELTHGLSNRLHNNTVGLNNQMARAMGEGWSDFYARALLSTASEDVNGVYPMGGWVTLQLANNPFTDNYYYGIRRFPYAVKTTVGANGKPHNPLTFADIDPAQVNITDGAYQSNPLFFVTANEVHNAGEVWAMTLLEVRARFIARLGFATGNQRILQFVTDAMKLDVNDPTFLQARDSILQAANLSGDANDVADIWAGFATRGMGVTATNDAATFAVTESFSSPGAGPMPTFTINDVSVPEGNSGTATATFTVSLAHPSPAESRVSYTTSNGSAANVAATPANPTSITVNDNTTATPYPKTLNISGMTGTIKRLRVTLNNVTHTWPSDMDILLTGPAGQRLMLMSDVDEGYPISAVSITFDDGAPPLWQGGPITTGSYAPTDLDPIGETLPGPAPGAPNITTLSGFNGTDPNGNWSLYVVDDFTGDSGIISGGFSLNIDVGSGDYAARSGQLIFPPGTTSQTVDVAIAGEATLEANETFTVNLSNPINAVIGNAQGVGTIVNDDGGGSAATVVTGTASVTPFGATLNGTANPNGNSTTAFFQYGTNGGYVYTTPPAAMGSGGSPVAIAGGTISGLTCNKLYLFRARAVNGGGTVNGLDNVFRTEMCTNDIDGDGKTERTIWRPSTGVWFSSMSGGTATATAWGVSTDIDVMGDYDGDGKVDIAVWRPSTGQRFIIQSNTSTIRIDTWGTSGDIQLAGDVDGDGQADLVVFRPSTGTWYVKKSTGGTTTTSWGLSTDQPLLGDYDGDGKGDIVVFRNGVWYIRYSGGDTFIGNWGTSGDVPVVGDYDGDGKADLAVFRPGTGQWFVSKSSGGFIIVAWGTSGDVPVSGDQDGDGTSDFTVWRPGNGTWYTQYAVGGTAALSWGIAGDKIIGRIPGS